MSITQALIQGLVKCHCQFMQNALRCLFSCFFPRRILHRRRPVRCSTLYGRWAEVPAIQPRTQSRYTAVSSGPFAVSLIAFPPAVPNYSHEEKVCTLFMAYAACLWSSAVNEGCCPLPLLLVYALTIPTRVDGMLTQPFAFSFFL